MAVLYLDASAVVKYYVLEPGSTWVRDMLNTSDELTGASLNTAIIADVSIAEVAAAFAVLHRHGILRRRTLNIIFDHFMDDVLHRYYLAGTTREHFFDAARLTQQHPLKAYDAVQLAVALHQQRALRTVHQTLTFVSGDQKQLAAASAEGLSVENPFDHVSPQDVSGAKT